MNAIPRRLTQPSAACLLFLSISACRAAAPEGPWKSIEPVGQIELPGVEGRIDHLTLASDGTELWVAAKANHTVEIVNLIKGEVVATIRDLPEPQGIVAIPYKRAVAVGCGGDGTLRIFSEQSKTQILQTSLGDDADNVRFDAERKRIFVAFGGGAVREVGADDLLQISEYKTPGHPESFQFERNRGRIYINVPADRSIHVFDRDAKRLLARWPVPAAKNYPMELDTTDHRLFIACREPSRLIVYNTDKGEVVDSAECSGDADDIYYNSDNAQIYISCGEGFLDIFDARPGAPLARIERIAASPGARTCLFDTKTGRLYVAAPKSAANARIFIYQIRRAGEAKIK